MASSVLHRRYSVGHESHHREIVSDCLDDSAKMVFHKVLIDQISSNLHCQIMKKTTRRLCNSCRIINTLRYGHVCYTARQTEAIALSDRERFGQGLAEDIPR